MVGLAVTDGAAEGSGEVEVDARDVGAGQVIHRDGIGAAERVEEHPLDSVDVHGDVPRVAEEPQSVTVRRQVDRVRGCGAVEDHRVPAVLALDRVAAVARVPDERVVASAEGRTVAAPVSVDRVVAVAAEERFRARAAGDRVVAVPAVEELADRPARKTGGGDCVVAAEGFDEELVCRLLMLDRDLRLEARHRDAGRVPGHVHRIVPAGAGDEDAVGLTVTRRAAQGAGKVDVDVLDVGAAEVVDGDRVGAAERVEVDLLDSVGVHRDVRRAAEEPQPVPVGRQVDRLGSGGTVEHHRVGARSALDRVAAVTRVPDEGVVARAEIRGVVAPLAVDRVVAGAADQRLRTGAAADRVVPRSALDPRRDGVGERAVRVVDAHRVVAPVRRNLDVVDRGPGEGEVRRPVVAEIHLDDGGVPGREPKRDRIVRLGPLHAQRATFEPHAHRLGAMLCRGSLRWIGRGRCDRDETGRRNRQDRETPEPHCDLLHGDSFLRR